MSTNEWVFGSSPESDVWVPESTVSASHCSLRKTSQGYRLRDLDSTNGTFVDGAKIRQPTSIGPETHVMLGGLITLPWPEKEGASRVVRFGRGSQNDYVIDAPNVSTFHGEIVVGHSGTWVVVDLGSTNGIGLKQGRKFHVIRRAAMISPNDTLLLGKTELRVQDITPLFRGTPASDSVTGSRPALSAEHPAVDNASTDELPQAARSAAIPRLSTATPLASAPAWLLFGVGLLIAVLVYVWFVALR
ncbi:FHA domain protein [Roseimaritima ulvae]|uniref:FHA domain protein n=1 Tax=Roseimaritima ulvae TaxID=980254 RepID=A0A5B9QZQ2_9BACT|nr:FHA domain protein [Roseimaritima ulvae]